MEHEQTPRQRLIAWLRCHGVKQKWLAREIPVRHETVCRWLSDGGTDPGLMARRRIYDITSGEVPSAGDWNGKEVA